MSLDDRNRRRRRLLVAALAALAVVASVGASLRFAQGFAQGGSDARVGQVDTSVAGVRAAPFAIPSLDGATVRLDDLKGSVVVVNFWASWCVPCREESDALRALERRWGPRGIRLVGVDENDTVAEARAFRKRHDLAWPSGLDSDRAVAIEFGVRGVPETYVIDRSGRLVGKVLGRLRVGELDAMLAALLAEGGVRSARVNRGNSR